MDVYTRTICTIAFCKEIERLGYKAGIYSTQYWFMNKLEYYKIKDYNIWCADWDSDNGLMGTPPTIKYDMWQYTSKGTIPGIKTNVDLNSDVSAYITTSKPSEPKKSVDEIAKEVINGKWGVGTDRKNALTKAGYDYTEVQLRVNQILNGTNNNIKFNLGDKVKVSLDATFIDGRNIAFWVKLKTLYIRSDEYKDGSYIVST